MVYVCIIAVILCICSVDLHQKDFSTCAPYFPIFLIFLQVCPQYTCAFLLSTLFFLVISLMFAVLSPFINPIIYSLRKKDIKEAIDMYMYKSTIFKHHIK